MFRFTEVDLAPYRGKKPPFGVIGAPTYMRTYSRPVEDEEGKVVGKEQFLDTIVRVIEGNVNLGQKNGDPTATREWALEALKYMFYMGIMPPGRGYWMMGTKYAEMRGGDALNNCFRKGTLVHTEKGVVPIEQLVGKTVKVLSQDGKYREATFKSYGVQPLMRVEFGNGDVVYATPEHQWVLWDGKGKKIKTNRVFTKDLKRSHVIPLNFPEDTGNLVPDVKGVAHGFVYGDGTINTYKVKDGTKSYALVRFPNEVKRKYLFDLVKQFGTDKSDWQVPAVIHLPVEWKSVPEPEHITREYALGFIVGLISADGYVRESISIHQADKEELEKIRRLAMWVGLKTLPVRMDREISPYTGEVSPMYVFTISTASLHKDLLIRADQKDKWKCKKGKIQRTTSIKKVEYTAIEEEVYCCEEMETHTMTIESGILTGQCWYVAVRPQSYEDIEMFKDQPYIFSDPWKEMPSYPFVFMFDRAMLGGGVGFGISKDNMNKIPKVTSKLDLKIFLHPKHPDWERIKSSEEWERIKDVITTDVSIAEKANSKGHLYFTTDDREGWDISVREMIDAHFQPISVTDLVIDLSRVRQYGARIKGFGGTSSGPLPLITALVDINNILNSRVTQSLKSEDGLDIMNLLGRCVVAGNVRRCLPEGTMVHTTSGLKPIEDIKVGDTVYTSKGTSKVLDHVDQGVQGTVYIRTQLGNFECTDRHRMAVLIAPNKYKWKMAYEIKAGDRLVFPVNSMEGVETSLPQYGVKTKKYKDTNSVDIKIPELDEEMAWFFGYFQGKGYVDSKSVSVDVPDDLLSSAGIRVKEQMERFGVRIQEDSKRKDKCSAFRVSSVQLADYLYQFKQPNKSINIPSFILSAKQNIRVAYLNGVMDANGTVKNKPIVLCSSVYPDFLKQLQAVYHSLGIPTRFELKRAARGNWKDLYNLNLVGKKFIKDLKSMSHIGIKISTVKTPTMGLNEYGFPRDMVLEAELPVGKYWDKKSAQLTYSRLKEVLPDWDFNYIPIEVKSVDLSGRKVQTYDITTEAQEFIAEGLLVHNTALIALGDATDEDYTQAKNYTRVLPIMEKDEKGYTVWETNKWGRMVQKRRPFNDVVGEIYDKKRAELGTTVLTESMAMELQQQAEMEAQELYDLAFKQENHRWASNNSVYTYEMFEDHHFIAAGIIANGEPGVGNKWLMENFGRIKDGYQEGIDSGAIGLNPCAEITLNSNEPCNLVEFVPLMCMKFGLDFRKGLEIAAQYAYRITFAKYTWPATQRIISKNRRIGVSLTGMQDYFLEKYGHYAVKGFEDEDITKPIFHQEIVDELDDWYHVVKEVNYWHSYRMNSKPSIKLTTVKPSGTVAKLPGVSSGIHWNYAPYMIQRIRFHETDPNLEVLKACGFPIEKSYNEPNTMVVEFPIKNAGADNPNFLSSGDVPLEVQFANQYLFAYIWADNAVSATLTFQQDEINKIEPLLKAYNNRIKSTSLLPYVGNGYTQAPWQPITKEEYERRVSELQARPEDIYDLFDLTQEIDDDLLDSDCIGGSCPIR